jgi:aryl-alcohol dehydrogenase-like predicted oxidoreductase
LELWSKAPALFDSIYKDGGKSKAQLALQFCLAFDSVSTVIPGMVKIAEVEENCRTSYLSPLTRGEIELIRLIYRSNTFMSSKSKNKVIRARYNS